MLFGDGDSELTRTGATGGGIVSSTAPFVIQVRTASMLVCGRPPEGGMTEPEAAVPSSTCIR